MLLHPPALVRHVLGHMQKPCLLATLQSLRPMKLGKRDNGALEFGLAHAPAHVSPPHLLQQGRRELAKAGHITGVRQVQPHELQRCLLPPDEAVRNMQHHPGGLWMGTSTHIHPPTAWV